MLKAQKPYVKKTLIQTIETKKGMEKNNESKK